MILLYHAKESKDNNGHLVHQVSFVMSLDKKVVTIGVKTYELAEVK